MKRFFSMLVVLIMLFALVGCNSSTDATIAKNEANVPRFFNPIPFYPEIVKYEEPDVETVTITSKEQKRFEDIFEALSQGYGINKSSPNLRVISAESMYRGYGTIEVDAFYTEYADTITWVEGTLSEQESIAAHEVLHYLSDNGEFVGIRYNICGYSAGSSLDEGITNLFSTQYFPHQDGLCIYEFETEVAELFSIIYGEEFEKIYFSSNVESLKEDFNKDVQDIYFGIDYEFYNGEVAFLTPFDILVGSLNAYTNSLMLIEQNPEEHIVVVMSQVDMITEMMLYYAKANGKEKEVKKSLKEFVKNEKMIAWSEYSSILEIIE